jgi:two-component system LytT family sensor kinase
MYLSVQDVFFTLLVKVGWAASLAALLARSGTFRRILFTEHRDSDQKVQLLLFFTPPLALGILMRLAGYRFADLMVEGSIVMGLLGGRMVGLLGGSLISLPAFVHHEWLSTPLAASIGLLAGVVREIIPNKEDIWDFGPFLFLNIPASIVALLRDRRFNWAMLPLGACTIFELGHIVLADTMPSRWLFSIAPANGWLVLLMLLASIMAVALPIKIWNSTRVEMNLEQNQQLLLKARMDALSAQINPHFLFNTLNTVSSLIRYEPDQARIVVIKLSSILRRLLRKHETFVPLRDELTFMDDYLDIEVARFGHDKLEIFKEIEPDALDAFIPSMLLQPIVENALKHGLSPRLEGGQIILRARRIGGHLSIDVEDNGAGISQDRLVVVYAEGIGISNVHERLRLLYGDQFRMDINSQEGKGTQVHIEVPELVSTAAIAE